MIILSDKTYIPQIFRSTTNYLWNKGYRAALPDLIIEEDGYMYVTCPKAEIAEVVDVVSSKYFKDVNHDDIPARFRASLTYAGENGYPFAYPNFHEAIKEQGHVYGTNLIRSEAIEIRDVLANEFGDIDFDDIPRRIRGAGNYAIRNNFAWGCPNFHQAQTLQGIVYGTVLFKTGYIERVPVKFTELFNGPTDIEAILNKSENYVRAWGNLKININDIEDGFKEGFNNAIKYLDKKVTKQLGDMIKNVFNTTKNLINAGDVHKFAKNTALNAAKEQKSKGSSEELCSNAVRDIMLGIAIIIQGTTTTVPNPYAIALAGAANSLSKWACHEVYKEE